MYSCSENKIVNQVTNVLPYCGFDVKNFFFANFSYCFFLPGERVPTLAVQLNNSLGHLLFLFQWNTYWDDTQKTFFLLDLLSSTAKSFAFNSVSLIYTLGRHGMNDSKETC